MGTKSEDGKEDWDQRDSQGSFLMAVGLLVMGATVEAVGRDVSKGPGSKKKREDVYRRGGTKTKCKACHHFTHPQASGVLKLSKHTFTHTFTLTHTHSHPSLLKLPVTAAKPRDRAKGLRCGVRRLRCPPTRADRAASASAPLTGAEAPPSWAAGGCRP